jgi:hypothetical protein
MQQHSANDFNIVSESKLKIQSVDLTTIQADNNGIYLYATGGNNNIDMTSGSLRIATEVKANPEVEGITDADTHHLGQIDIQSANNIRIESKGTPAENPPSTLAIEDSEGFIDIKSSAGIRQAAENNINIECGGSLLTHSEDNTAMNAIGTMAISGDTQTNLTSDAAVHIRGTTTYIDDIVRMAEGGSVSSNDNKHLMRDNINRPVSAFTAEIASTTRTTDASGDDDKKQLVKALGVNKEDFAEGNLVLHGAAPTPPKSQGEGKGFKQKDQVGTIPNPTQTNPPVTTTPGVED